MRPRPSSRPAPLNWGAAEQFLGAHVRKDYQQWCARENVSEKHRSTGDRALRHLATVLDKRGDREARRFLDVLCGNVRPEADDTENLRQLMDDWAEDWCRDRVYSNDTVYEYVAAAATAFEGLHRMIPDRYPPFERSMIVVRGQGGGRTIPMSEFDWSELKGVRGEAARLRLALDLVRSESLQTFDAEYHLFGLGQLMLDSLSPPPGVDERDWWLVRQFLAAEDASWRTVGRSMLARGGRADPVTGSLKRLGEHETWRCSGMSLLGGGPVFPAERSSRAKRFELQSIALACLGPRLKVVKAFMAVFCCETGFNRQPMCDLPRRWAAFRTASGAWLGTHTFLASMKRRGGREVVALLTGDVLPRFQEEQMLAHWRAAGEEEFGGPRSPDCNAYVREGSLLAGLLPRFEAMSKRARSYDLSGACADSFLFYLTPNNGLRMPDYNLSLAESAEQGSILSRKGVTFMSIRATFLLLTYANTNSLAQTSLAAQHAGTSVTERRYLNSAYVRKRQDENMLLFSRSLEALTINGKPSWQLKLGISSADVEWFLLIARSSGLAAALGFSLTGVGSAPSPFRPAAETKPLTFFATKTNLRSLYLAHRALTRARITVPPGRWTHQGAPLLAYLKAIGGKLRDAGMWPSYRAEARRARQELERGLIRLPAVLAS